MTTDRLAWWEELPLALATIAQSVVVGVWYYHSIDLGSDRLNLAVAIVAGLALDAIVVTTVMGRRVGRESRWSLGAALGAFACSALIAIDTYSAWLVPVQPLLHVSYPLMVFLYSQHLASARVAPTQAAQEPPGATEAPEVIEATPRPLATIAPAQPERLTLLAPSAYTCPHCSAPLKNKQAAGAAKTNGYCLNCKAKRKAA